MSTNRIRLLALVLALPLAAAVCTHEPSPGRETSGAALRKAVDARRPPFTTDEGARGRRAWQETQRFYKQNEFQFAWTDGRRTRSNYDALLRALHASERDGLDPDDYFVADLESHARAGLTLEQAVALDIRATYEFMRSAWDIAHGTIDPEKIDPHWHAAPRSADLPGALQSGIASGDIERALTGLAPSAPQYRALKAQLARARARGDAAAIDHIAMNMDRWRWMPDKLGDRYILVNIPAFRLDAIEHGSSVLAMKVVTGKKASPTPVLADEMTSIVFSPYWNIPDDIVEKEIRPKVDRDPDYLAKANMEVDQESGRIRQRPGKGNSLGRVKFVFPNHFNVYLHDTPAQALFNRVERDFSHGCVRLDDPEALAQYVLRDQPEWTPEKIKSAMNSGTEHAVKLKQPLPIYLAYFTAWDDNGELETVPDVYGLDRRHETAEKKR